MQLASPVVNRPSAVAARPHIRCTRCWKNQTCDVFFGGDHVGTRIPDRSGFRGDHILWKPTRMSAYPRKPKASDESMCGLAVCRRSRLLDDRGSIRLVCGCARRVFYYIIILCIYKFVQKCQMSAVNIRCRGGWQEQRRSAPRVSHMC